MDQIKKKLAALTKDVENTNEQCEKTEKEKAKSEEREKEVKC